MSAALATTRATSQGHPVSAIRAKRVPAISSMTIHPGSSCSVENGAADQRDRAKAAAKAMAPAHHPTDHSGEGGAERSGAVVASPQPLRDQPHPEPAGDDSMHTELLPICPSIQTT